MYLLKVLTNNTADCHDRESPYEEWRDFVVRLCKLGSHIMQAYSIRSRGVDEHSNTEQYLDPLGYPTDLMSSLFIHYLRFYIMPNVNMSTE